MQVNLSQGPHMQATSTVPAVVGQTLTEAVSTLNGAHLRLIFAKFPVDSRAQAGKIVWESPGAGAHAPQNAQVLVLLGAYRSG
jgi:beta-lactam-binding protein with PASTA domain